jgi:hypothetical protein
MAAFGAEATRREVGAMASVGVAQPQAEEQVGVEAVRAVGEQ